jgi:hypothetical protein
MLNVSGSVNECGSQAGPDNRAHGGKKRVWARAGSPVYAAGMR